MSMENSIRDTVKDVIHAFFRDNGKIDCVADFDLVCDLTDEIFAALDINETEQDLPVSCFKVIHL